MVDAVPNGDFSFKSMDWAAYETYRPTYPRALYELIYDHHAAQGGEFGAALDVGAGGGMVTAALLQRFARVTLSDASALYVSQAQARFVGAEERLSFLHRRAEDLEGTKLPDGPVDLLTAGMCLHWADLEACMPRLHGCLRRGGTMAAWIYGTQPAWPDDDAPGAACFARLSARLVDIYAAHTTPDHVASVGGRVSARLDCMSLDPALWRDVHRIYTRHECPMATVPVPPAPSCVRTAETQTDLRQALLVRDADYAWIEGYMENLIPPLEARKNAAAEFAELESHMGSRTVRLEWPLALVLATRI